MKQIKTEVKYLSGSKPEVEVMVIPICKDVWYVWIDFYERFDVHGYGGGDDSPTIIYFAHPKSNEIDFEVDLFFPQDGHVFGAVYKKTYHGTFYTHSKYESMIDKHFTPTE